MEPEDAYEPPDHQELRSSSSTDVICKLSTSSASGPVEVKDELEEDVWEAIGDGPLVKDTLPEFETKCFSQVFSDLSKTSFDIFKKNALCEQFRIAHFREYSA